jgi:hypothetical protein
MTDNQIQYDTETRNRTVRVNLGKGAYYTDELTGYWYENGGRKYHQTMHHGYVERSHFKFERPARDNYTLSAAALGVLRSVRT